MNELIYLWKNHLLTRISSPLLPKNDSEPYYLTILIPDATRTFDCKILFTCGDLRQISSPVFRSDNTWRFLIPQAIQKESGFLFLLLPIPSRPISAVRVPILRSPAQGRQGRVL